MSAFFDTSLLVNGERPELELSPDGSWFYAGTTVPAVGARHISLSEAISPRKVERDGEGPEAVLLSLSEVSAQERLSWVIYKGQKLSFDDGEPHYLVPWAVWQEYSAAPVDATLPEVDGTGVDRALAVAERRFRFAKQAADEAAAARARVVLLATQLGRSRREVGELMGLSAGRVQQLNESPAAEVVEQFEAFRRDATAVLELLIEGTRELVELRSPTGFGSDQLDELIGLLSALGLVREVAGVVEITADGRRLLVGPAVAVSRGSRRLKGVADEA